MCSPAMAAVMMGAQVAGGLYQAQAERQAGADRRRYYNFLASQNESQATNVIKRGEEQATAISGESAVEQSTTERSALRVEGAQRAAFGASGVASGSVTAEDVARDTLTTHQRDMAALRYDADSKVWATKTAAEDQARSLRGQADAFRMSGDNAAEAGNVAANSTLIGTATSVGDTWYRYGQTGAGRAPATVKTRTPRTGYATAPDYGNA